MKPNARIKVTLMIAVVGLFIALVVLGVHSVFLLDIYLNKPFHMTSSPDAGRDSIPERRAILRARAEERALLDEYDARRVEGPEISDEEAAEEDAPDIPIEFDLSPYEEVIAGEEYADGSEESLGIVETPSSASGRAVSEVVTLRIPDDFATLEEALETLGNSGGPVELVLRRSRAAYEWPSGSSVLRRSLRVVGETGDPADAGIVFPQGLTIEVEDSAAFEGLALRAARGGEGRRSAVITTVSGTLEARNCVFEGVGGTDSVGAAILGGSASGKFFRCVWRNCGSGIYVSGGSIWAYSCKFTSQVGIGVETVRGARIEVDEAVFDVRGSGMSLGAGTTGTVSNSTYPSGVELWRTERPDVKPGAAFWNNKER